MHLPPVPRFFVRWIIRTVLALIFVGCPAVLFYLSTVGFGYAFKGQVANALSGVNHHTSIGKLLFNPFKGLIAEDVTVTETGPERRNLAQVERLVVSIALNDLLSRRVTIDFVELDDTEVSVPLVPGSDKRLNLSNVTAQCLLFAGQLRISYFDAQCAGLHIMLSGLLQNPQDFRPRQSGAAPDSTPRTDGIARLVEQISSLSFQGANPELRAQITGDLADVSTITVSPISLRTGPVVGADWRVESVEANAQYREGAFTVTQCLVKGAQGSLNLNAIYRQGVVQFELFSNILPASLFGLLPAGSPLRNLAFEDQPQIDVYGEINLDEKPLRPDITGHIQCGRFSFNGMKLDAFSTDFVLRDGRFFARDTRVLASGGELQSDVLLAPGDFRLRLTDSIIPLAFMTLLGDKEQAFLKQMQFKDNPLLKVDIRGARPDFAAVTGQGSLHLGRTAIRGAWIDSADATLEIANRAVTYRDFTIKAGKGTGTGTFVYDFGGQQVRLQKIDSTLVPVDVMMWIDPKIADALRPYRFREPPRVRAEGMVHLKDPHKNALSLKIDAPGGLDYDLLKKTLHFGRTQADVDVISTKVHANISNAQLMGGNVGMKAVVSIDASDPTFGADIDIRRVNFARLTKLYFDYDDSEGILSGRYKFTARAGQEEKMQGEGSIRVEDGHVFAIPILGPLSDIINKIIPGSGYQTARVATGDFQVADEKISTKNLAIEGAGFSLIGHGSIFFMTDKMDMSVRINARGVPGIVLFPVSKLFEYVSTGTVSNPEWRPKIIPRFGNGSAEGNDNGN